MAKKEEIIVLNEIEVKHAKITIEGDSELVLNQMNARTKRQLTAERKSNKGVKETVNMWEDLATAIHWRDPYRIADTRDMTEEEFQWMLENNAPCISAFGLKKSICQAIVRNQIDTYATKLDASITILAPRSLVPITFNEWCVDERLMSPQRGAPVLVRINHFVGWKATFQLDYVENVYSLNEITNIINLAGFGLGIGSGRSSGYGRYHVSGVE